MRKHHHDIHAPPPEELIASFGEARLVRTLDGKIQLRGGSPEDQARAREWMEQYLLPPTLTSGPQRP